MIRGTLLAVSLGLMVFWYANPTSTPNPSPEPPVGPVASLVIQGDSVAESFPTAPPEASQKLLEPLSGIFTQNPNDALELARATKQWAQLVSSETDLGDLTQFIKVQDSAFRNLGKSAQLKGTYANQLNPVAKALYNHYLPQLKDGEGNVSGITVDASVRSSLSDYFNALSWKFSQEWLKEVSKPKPTA